MRALPTALLALLMSSAALATETITVRGIPADMPLMQGARCYIPLICVKKGETLPSYEAGVWGRPKFLPGSVRLANGAELSGRVAMFQIKNDWEFVQNAALLIPDGEEDAYYFGPSDAPVVRQQDDDQAVVYDNYGGSFLKRLVSGPVRLSYNPAAGTSAALSSFISPIVLEDAQREMAGRTVLEGLKSGKSVREATAVADLKQQALDAILSIEITEKEYLIYDERKQTTVAINEDNYRERMSAVLANCPAVPEDEAKSLAKKMKRIEDAVKAINQACP